MSLNYVHLALLLVAAAFFLYDFVKRTSLQSMGLFFLVLAMIFIEKV